MSSNSLPLSDVSSDSKPPETNVMRQQIDNVRNVDSETGKPRLNTSKSTKPEKTVKKTDLPTKSSSSSLFAILTPYLRTPLTGKPELQVSTFVPCAFHMYEILHLMDDIMRRSFYFKRQQDSWHPLISRLYFGILFYIQTLRADLKAGTIIPANKRFLLKFLSTYPPESLMIPGPLVAIFEALNVTRPTTPLFGLVTPHIPKSIGRYTADTLIRYEEGNSYHLQLPYIPGILGFIQNILSAPANAIPDYTLSTTFDNTAARTLNEHVFAVNHWTELERATLLQPGMLYLPETDRPIDMSFNQYGKRLNIPVPQGTSDITTLEHFLFLGNDSWFGATSQIMACYSSYFIGSTNLSNCDTTNSVAPLITSQIVSGSTPLAVANPIHTLTHAFPSNGVFSDEYVHQTTETDLPSVLSMVATSSKLNCFTSLADLGHYSSFGAVNISRLGPYWLHIPQQRITAKECTTRTLGSLISEKYSIMRANQPKDE